MTDKKTDIPGVFRSSDGFLINKDNTALESYRKRRIREKELDNLSEEVRSLKDDMQEIKEMLKKVLN